MRKYDIKCEMGFKLNEEDVDDLLNCIKNCNESLRNYIWPILDRMEEQIEFQRKSYLEDSEDRAQKDFLRFIRHISIVMDEPLLEDEYYWNDYEIGIIKSATQQNKSIVIMNGTEAVGIYNPDQENIDPEYTYYEWDKEMETIRRIYTKTVFISDY